MQKQQQKLKCDFLGHTEDRKFYHQKLWCQKMTPLEATVWKKAPVMSIY